MKNSEECEFKGLTFDEASGGHEKRPPIPDGIEAHVPQQSVVRVPQWRLEFREIPFESSLCPFFLSPPRNYSVYSIKDDLENGPRRISELGSLVSTP